MFEVIVGVVTGAIFMMVEVIAIVDGQREWIDEQA